MTPDTVHRIAQEIRNERALLTIRETWLQKQEKSTARDEEFRYINWKRRILKFAETELISHSE